MKKCVFKHFFSQINNFYLGKIFPNKKKKIIYLILEMYLQVLSHRDRFALFSVTLHIPFGWLCVHSVSLQSGWDSRRTASSRRSRLSWFVPHHTAVVVYKCVRANCTKEHPKKNKFYEYIIHSFFFKSASKKQVILLLLLCFSFVFPQWSYSEPFPIFIKFWLAEVAGRQ